MAILHRFGSADEFDPNKMQARELAYVNTTNSTYKAGLYLCYAPGDVRRQTTEEDIMNLLNAMPDAYTALQQLLADLEANPSELTNILSNITTLQADKLDKVGDSKDNITTFTEYETDTDITSGETHATILGKILKSIKTLRYNIGVLTTEKIDKSAIVNQDAINDVNKVPSSAVTYAHGQAITQLNNNLADQGWKDATLINGWTGTLKYRKNGKTIEIYITGVINTIVTTLAVFNMPAGYRPVGHPVFNLISDTTNGTANRIAVTADGSVYIQSLSGASNTANAIHQGSIMYSV